MIMKWYQILIALAWFGCVIFAGYIFYNCRKVKKEGCMPDIEDMPKNCQCED